MAKLGSTPVAFAEIVFVLNYLVVKKCENDNKETALRQAMIVVGDPRIEELVVYTVDRLVNGGTTIHMPP
jgi:hypothetical protein